jgi:hypothetical protein
MTDSRSPSLAWHRASQCDNAGCIEAATGDFVVMIRDSVAPEKGVLTVSPGQWAEFLVDVRNNRAWPIRSVPVGARQSLDT